MLFGIKTQNLTLAVMKRTKRFHTSQEQTMTETGWNMSVLIERGHIGGGQPVSHLALHQGVTADNHRFHCQPADIYVLCWKRETEDLIPPLTLLG